MSICKEFIVKFVVALVLLIKIYSIGISKFTTGKILGILIDFL